MNPPISVTWLQSMLKPDVTLQFAVDDGRVMTWAPGHYVYCRVSFPSIVPGYYTITEREQRVPDASVTMEEDLVVARVEVASNTGEMYGAERTLSANVFVEAIRTADAVVSADTPLDPIATGVTYRHDGRRHMVAARVTRDEIEGVSYYLKNLVGTLDLFYWSRASYLVIRLHATQLGAAGGRPTPEVMMGTKAAAQIVLMPSLLTGGLWLPPAPLVFTRCEHSDRPQEGVRVR
jgi:hypothetical protein